MEETTDKKPKVSVSIKALPNGPLIVNGSFNLTLPDGVLVEHKGSTSLCRCGMSKNKPYCDGAHQKSDFDK